MDEKPKDIKRGLSSIVFSLSHNLLLCSSVLYIVCWTVWHMYLVPCRALYCQGQELFWWTSNSLVFFSRFVGSDNPETYFTDTERTRVVSFDLSLEIIVLVYTKLVNSQRQEKNEFYLVKTRLERWLLMCMSIVFCKPVDIPWISRAWVANQSMQKWIFTGLIYTNNYYPELFYTGNISN